MWVLSAALLVGFLVLFKSADLFVTGSIATARNLKIPSILIGLTIVALGTSAPEIFVAAASSIEGKPGIAVGNAIGSNIANIGMVLGITALIVPLGFRRESLAHDLPIMAVATITAGFVLSDYTMSFIDGLLLVGVLLFFVICLIRNHRNNKNVLDVIAEEIENEDIPEMSTVKATVILVVSLIFLLASAEILVWTVTEIARKMGISELIIGLTVIAVGTSLPELVVSISSATKGQNDLAVGNIIGSNIFNILIVLAIPAFTAESVFSSELFWRDYMGMLVMTGVLMLAAYTPFKKAGISRPEGAIMVMLWFCYLIYLYYSGVAQSL